MADREVIDIDVLMERVDGDRALAEIAALFLERSGRSMEAIELAIVSHDLRALETSVHELRGCLTSLCARRSSDLALELESKGRMRDAVGIRYLFCKLEEEIDRLKPILALMPERR